MLDLSVLAESPSKGTLAVWVKITLEGSFFDYMFGGAKTDDPSTIGGHSTNNTESTPLTTTAEATSKNLRAPSSSEHENINSLPPAIPAIPPVPRTQVVVPDTTTEIPEDMPPIDIEYDIEVFSVERGPEGADTLLMPLYFQKKWIGISDEIFWLPKIFLSPSREEVMIA